MDLVSTLRPSLVIDLDNIVESIPLNMEVFHGEDVGRDVGHLPLHLGADGLRHASHGFVTGRGRGSPPRRALLHQLFHSGSKEAPGQLVHLFRELALVLHLVHVEVLNLAEGC